MRLFSDKDRNEGATDDLSMISAILLWTIVISAGAWLGPFLFRDNNASAVLAGPSLLATAWTLGLGLTVNHGFTLERLWGPFWIATAVLGVAGSFRIIRNRSASLFIAPTLAALILLAPYVTHGFASFPGSWFWDGFAYLSGAESLWRFTRDADPSAESILYQFGHALVQGRFISMALIGIFRSVLPIGGDSQGATGYFLLFCTLTFANSMMLLARTILPSRPIDQLLMMSVATISGSLLNLIWANNFDHLLAMSIAPAMLAAAFNAEWRRFESFLLIGAMAAAQFYIYPEMAPLFVLPVAAVLFFRSIRETLPPLEKSMALAAMVLCAAVLTAPLFSQLFEYFRLQLIGSFQPAESRAGSGLFPTFIKPACTVGSLFGLYQPFQRCAFSIELVVKLLIGLAGSLVVLMSLQDIRKYPGLIVTNGLFIAALGFFLIVQRYDYGSYKISETSWVPALSLCALASTHWLGWKRRLSSSLAVSLLIVSIVRIFQFDSWVTIKSIDPYSALKTLPKNEMIALRIRDHFAFEWAAYYLRDYQTAIGSGALAYFASPDPKTEPTQTRLRSAKIILTDVPDASLGLPVWKNAQYIAYSTTVVTSK
jgi:hypothetical protein